jgi:hypothetical protein
MKIELSKYKKKKPPEDPWDEKKGCLAILASPPSIAMISPPNSLASLRWPTNKKEDDWNPFPQMPLEPLLPVEVDNTLS